jgi:hypothetical protein
MTGLASFNRAAFASEAALYGRNVKVGLVTYLMLVRAVDALELAQGGFEHAGGELRAQYQGDNPPAVHAVATVDGQTYRITSISTLGGGRYALNLRLTNSTK